MAVHFIDSNPDNQVRVPVDILEGIFERNVVRRRGENGLGEIRWTYDDATTGKTQTIVSSRYSQSDVDAIHFGMLRQRRAPMG